MMRETGVENGVIYGEKIVDAALDQLDKHRDGPTYLFLGTIDTHGPWIAREPWIDIYSPGPYHGPFQKYGTAKDLGFKPGSMGCSIIPPTPDIERLRAIYDSAVSYQDLQVGRLVAQLKSWGIWDQTMLIDHRRSRRGAVRGSALRPRRLAARLADCACRCSSTIPSRFPAGTIVDEGAEGVDLLPTMLDARRSRRRSRPPRAGRSSRSRRAPAAAGRVRRTRRCTSTRTRCGSGAGRRESVEPACR